MHHVIRFITRNYQKIISIFSVFVLLLPSLITPAMVFAGSTYNVVAGGDIQAAINGASSGDTIVLAAGIYNPTSTLIINKSLTLEGQGSGLSIIDAAGYTGYGINVTSSNVVLRNFSLRNAHGSSAYGIKISSSAAPTRLSNIQLSGVEVKDSYRSNIDFNGVDNISLVNVVVTGSSHGNGIALTDSTNAVLTNITTSGNAWGGIALYNSTYYPPALVSGISITGSNSFGESVGMYSERTSNPSGTIVAPTFSTSDFRYRVTSTSAPTYIWYYKGANFGLIPQVGGTQIFDLVNNYFVYPVPAAPVTLGYNVQSKASTPDVTPVAFTCGVGLTNDNTPSHVWTSVSGSNIKYQRQALAPSGSWWTDPTIYTATNTDWLWFGTAGQGNGLDGIWKVRVRAFEDSNNNNVLDSADFVSDWSNDCSITYDDTKPTTPSILVPNEGDAFNTTPILNDWTNSTDASGIAKYRVEYQYDDGHTFSGGPYRETTVSERNHSPMISEAGGVKFRVKAIDNVGNEGDWSEWRHYFYDITAGSSVFNAPVDNSKYKTPISINGSSLDNVGISFVSLYFKKSSDSDIPANWVKITDIANPVKDTPFNWSYIWTPSMDGVYDLKVTSTDKAGNVESTDYVNNITYDTTAPAVPVLVSPADGAVIKPSSANLDWSDVTDVNGPVTYNYRSSWAGGNYGPVSTGTNSIINATASADNLYNWQVQACDSLGNCSAWSGPWKVTIDGTVPTKPVWTNTAYFTQNGDATYTPSAVRKDMKFSQSSDTFGVNHYDYQYVREDLNGNKLGSGSVNMNSYLGGVTCASGICVWKPDMQDNSQWVFRMRAVDNAGNVSAWSNWNGATDAEFYNFSFKYQDYKNGSGIFASGYKGYISNAGNESYAVRENINPMSTITSPIGTLNTNSTNVLVNYTVSDSGTEVKNVKLYDSSDNYIATSSNGSFNITLPNADGVYCYYTVAEDIADDGALDLNSGNKEDVPADKCDVRISLDVTKPVVGDIKFIADFAGQYLFGQGFLVTANVSDTYSGIDATSCEFTFDGGAHWESGVYAGGKCSKAKTAGDNEHLTVNVRVKDNYGNQSTGVEKMRISDAANPTSSVTIANSYSGPAVFNSSTINGVANDSASKVESLTITIRRSGDNRYWNGSSFTCLLCFLPQFKSVSLSTLPTWTYGNLIATSLTNSKTYTITPYAVDSVGHVAQGTADAFIWDSTAPTNPSAFDSTPTPIYTNDNTLDINWPAVDAVGGASDTLSGVAGYSYSFTNAVSDIPDSVMDLTSDQVNVQSPVLADGTWYFHLKTVDNVGNWSDSVNVGPFIVDVTNPVLTISTPADNSWVNDFTVAGTVEDATSGINSVNVEFRNSSDDLLVTSCLASFDSSSWNLDVNGSSSCTVTDGSYNIVVTATDNATNSSTASKSNINVDTSKPTTSISGVDTQWHNTDVEVTLTCEDGSGSGCSKTYYTTDGTEPTTSSSQGNNFTLSTDGIFVIKYFSVDNVGNIENVKTFSSVNIDKTMPINPVGFTSSPMVDISSKGNTITVSWIKLIESELTSISSSASDNLSGVNGFSYSFTKDASETPDNTVDLDKSAFEASQSGLSDGHWFFNIKTVDVAGNWSETTSVSTFILDNQKPVITLIGTNSSLTVGSAYTDLGASAIDNEDGDLTAKIVTVNNVNTALAGTYTVTYNVTDSAGNIADQVSRTVTVKALPVLNNVEPQNTPEVEGATDEDKGEVLGTSCTTQQKLSGYVFKDKNGNDLLDNNEEGLNAVKVKVLEKSSDKEVANTTTDDKGKWEVSVCAGEYKVIIADLGTIKGYKLANNTTEVKVEENQDKTNVNFALDKNGFNWLWLLLLLILLLGGGYGYYWFSKKGQNQE